jgi:hypothetical protein
MKIFHNYKTQYDYYRTSRVMQKFFSGQVLNIHDKINMRSMYNNPKLIL